MHKPSNWWAREREPWLRIGRLASAEAERRETDGALAAVYAGAGATLPGATARPAGDGAAKADAVCAGLAVIGAVLPDTRDDDEDAG